MRLGLIDRLDMRRRQLMLWWGAYRAAYRGYWEVRRQRRADQRLDDATGQGRR